MPIRRNFPFAWPLLCILFAAISAMAAPSDSPFVVESWSAEDGLPDNEAIAVLQTRDGYLWIGTQHGLVRFDGNHFTIFDEMNTPDLKSDSIVFLFQDSQTNLWIGTQSSGLAMIRNGKVISFASQTAAAGPVTYAVEESGDLLFCSKYGIARYHNGQMNFYANLYSPQLSLRAQHMIIPSADGGLWQLWADGTVQKWSPDGVEKNFGPWPWKAPVTAACAGRDGNLIVGTLGDGVFWFDANGNDWRISKTDGLSSDDVLSLCLDDEGDLWVGTDGGGLDRVKRKTFNRVPGLHPWDVRSVAQDASGGLWAAFNAAGLSYWNTNGVADFGIGRGSNAWTVLVDRKQNVWAGTSTEGLFLFQSNQFSPAPGAGILGPEIFALFESRDGRLWAGTGNGLGRWDGNWKLFTPRDGLSDDSVRALAEDSAGNLWIGTERGGLDYFNGQKFVSFPAGENGPPGNDISCLYMDDEGVLWVGTFGHGLGRFDGKWTHFSKSDGLASNIISYIIGDDEGNLWIGSNAGLMRIKRKSLTGANNFFCRVYGRADGLPTRECSGGSQPAAIRAPDGQLFFPTIQGLVSIAPAKLRPNPRPPRVIIELVLVDGQEQNTNPLNSAWSRPVFIPPGGEQLDINYTALNFSSPQAVRFKYRLEGHENWVDAGAARLARYTDLPPGNYRFQVTACNEDGKWNDIGAALDVFVLPQFWQTRIFQIGVVLLTLGIIVGIVRYVSTQKLHRQVQFLKQREALEHERARIARDLHDQLGANLTQVALLGEMAEADKNLPDEVESHTRQISQTARETTRSLDEIVWAINPSNDTLEGLANYVCKYAQEYLALANLPCRVDVPAQLPAAAIPPEIRHNVFLAFKEAVHNVVKHAQAREVWVRLRLRPNQFTLEVEDNGRGIGKQETQNRNGLRNMKRRMEDIGGSFSLSSGANGGTLVRLTVPLK